MTDEMRDAIAAAMHAAGLGGDRPARYPQPAEVALFVEQLRSAGYIVTPASAGSTGKAEPPPTWIDEQRPVTAAALHEAVLDILSKASAPMTKADLIVAAQARIPNAGIQEISDAIDRGTTATRYVDQATGEELPPPPEGYHWHPPTRRGEKE